MPGPFDIALLETGEDSELCRLLKSCTDIGPLRYADGELLVRQDDRDQDLFIVVKGVFTVEQPPLVAGGTPVVLASVLCDPAHLAIVGEMAYFGDLRRTASVRSCGITYALRLKPAHIDVIIAGYPELTRVICQQFALRLKEANEVIRAFQSRFALVSVKRLVSEGELLFREGDPAPEIHQVLAGQVELSRGAAVTVCEPEDARSGFLEPEAFLAGRPHQTTARALRDSILVTVSREHADVLVRCYPELARLR
nr:cyclic nucleotide-binding domain-containing protein [uncultured Holophaga sp.]